MSSARCACRTRQLLTQGSQPDAGSTRMTAISAQAAGRQWFPRLSGGYVYPAGPYAQKLISVAWLLMTELEAYLEDLEGAANEPQVVDALRIKLAELMVDIDCRLAGADT
ncbi:hypothetical protein ALP03_04914, partial [Pseudomonas amygdali pv. tabaci]